jgi:hypothetical protein
MKRTLSIGLVTGMIVGAAMVSITRGGPSAAPKKLPAAVEQAVMKEHPSAKIRHFEVERRALRFYEVEVQVDGRSREILVASDGTLIESEESIKPDAAPAPISEALKKLSKSGVSELERIEVRAETRQAKLDTPRVEYEAEVRDKGKTREVRLSEDGRVLTEHVEDEDDDDGGADDAD